MVRSAAAGYEVGGDGRAKARGEVPGETDLEWVRSGHLSGESSAMEVHRYDQGETSDQLRQ